MNTWKERLIEYLQTIDGTMSLEEADKLIWAEWTKIKSDYLQKDRVAKNAETEDNHVQAEKSMSMSEVILMQLGPVRYKDLSKVSSELEHKVLVQETGISNHDLSEGHTTNELYDYLYINQIRNMQIVMDVRNCLDEKRYPIILTERKEHIDLLEKELAPYARVYKLHGGLKKKEREGIMEELQNLSENVQRVIIATSKYVGEGFDYPILDTLFLTLPISWSGRVKQYAGRLHRDYHEKKDVRIYDYLDAEIDTAMKMYGKRCKGYRSMGYEIIEK